MSQNIEPASSVLAAQCQRGPEAYGPLAAAEQQQAALERAPDDSRLHFPRRDVERDHQPPASRIADAALHISLEPAQAVEQVSGLRPRLKWPNDIEINRHKFGGILIEGEWRSDGPTYALIGIGVNVNFDPAPHAAQIDRPATSLMIELGHETPREPVLAALLNAFEAAYDHADSDEVFEAWRSRLDTLGRDVQIIGRETVEVEGVAEDVTRDGALLVRDGRGVLHTIIAGEVSVRDV